MLAFDIGANRGDFTQVALSKGYRVIALEPAPRVFNELIKQFIYNPNLTPLKFAVSDKDYETIKFYEADEDGLSTLNKEWLTNPDLPYAGKPFRTIRATTITLDRLIRNYGDPDVIKIDVEGAEWQVLRGLTERSGMIAFEWTDVTLSEHEDQLFYLQDLGYKEFAPQFIEHHFTIPEEWIPIGNESLTSWIDKNRDEWTSDKWKISNLRPTADVGMVWVK